GSWNATSRVRRSWDAIPSTGNGLNDRRNAELPPHHHDGEADDAREWVRVFVPYLLQQLLGGDYSALGSQELGKDREFLARQGHRQAVSGDGSTVLVQADAGAFQHRRCSGPGAPGQRMDAGD